VEERQQRKNKMPPSLRSGSRDSDGPPGRSTQVSSVLDVKAMSTEEILTSFAEVERCVAESLDREEAVKKQAAEEISAAKTREQHLLAEIKSLRETEKAADVRSEGQHVANNALEVEKTRDNEVVLGKSNITESEDVATRQVLAALSEMMNRLDGFQKVLDASAMAKSSRRPTEPMQTTPESVGKELPRSETLGRQARGHGKGKATKAHKSKDHTSPDDGDEGSSSSDDGIRKRRKADKNRSEKYNSRQSKTGSLDSYHDSYHEAPAEQLPLSDLIKL
jgi:hypothetical protein